MLLNEEYILRDKSQYKIAVKNLNRKSEQFLDHSTCSVFKT